MIVDLSNERAADASGRASRPDEQQDRSQAIPPGMLRPAGAERPDRLSRPGDAGGALRILLLEDNPSDAFLVHEYLEEDPEFHCQIEHVESVAAAKEVLASFEPDIALIDLSLPDSQGLETFSRIREATPDIPIVILSGLDDRDVAIDAVRRGAQDYLPKNDINGLLLTRVLRYAIERSRAERIMAARERRWRAMIERTSDVIAMLDERLRPLFVSASVEASTGYTSNELIGEDILAYVHPDDRGDVEGALQHTLATKDGQNVEYRFRRRDGEWIWQEAVATNLLDDPAVRAIVVNVRDIDERKKAEARSERDKRILQAAIDSLPGVFYLFDDAPQYILWNQNLEEMAGYSAEELDGINPLELVEERDLIAEEIGKAFAEGSATVEAHLLAKDGTKTPFLFTGRSFTLDDKPLLVGTGIDLTQRIEAERQVEFQASLLAQVKNSVIATDPEGRVTYWNAYAEELYGWTRAEAIGSSVLDLNVPESSVEDARDVLAQVAQTGRWEGEYMVQTKDGTVFPSWTSLTTIEIGGDFQGYLGISQDITERKQAEEERKRLVLQLSERVKELRLLHEASIILQDERQPLETTFEQIVERIPPAWKHPASTVARIRYASGGSSYEAASPEFRETPWRQVREFGTDGPGHGIIEVAYLTEQPEADRGPFLDEEYSLLESLMQMLRAYLDRRHSRERNESLTQDVSDQLSRASALQKISEATLSGMELNQTLDVVLEQVVGQLGVDAADVLLFDEANQTLDHAANTGFHHRMIEGASLRLGEGAGGRSALERKPIAIPDIAHSSVTFQPTDLPEREGFVSYYSIPLIAKGRLQGLLGMFHREHMEFPPEWRGFAADIAQHAAIAIENAVLVEDLQRSSAELQLSYERTIEGWARALDLKDEETAGHSQRVTKITVALAKKLGVHGEDLANMRRGALLHDIGKMGIPDNVLLKLGKLTADEWEIMKRHTTYARDFLADIPFLEKALDIPYAHHEKWDGSGYPRGLQRTEIPLGARIFAVVDVYDALTSERPYRAAWTHEKARDYILEESGKHFDPQIVAAFVQLLEEMKSAAE